MGSKRRQNRNNRRKRIEGSSSIPELSVNRLNGDVKENQKRTGGVPIGTIHHVEQAKALPIPEEVEEETPMHRAYIGYLDKRTVVSEGDARELGAPSVSAAAEQLVVQELVSSVQEARIEDLDMIAEGVRLARITLEDTYRA